MFAVFTIGTLSILSRAIPFLEKLVDARDRDDDAPFPTGPTEVHCSCPIDAPREQTVRDMVAGILQERQQEGVQQPSPQGTQEHLPAAPQEPQEVQEVEKKPKKKYVSRLERLAQQKMVDADPPKKKKTRQRSKQGKKTQRRQRRRQRQQRAAQGSGARAAQRMTRDDFASLSVQMPREAAQRPRRTLLLEGVTPMVDDGHLSFDPF